MATWLREQNVITDIGLEILSKLQAGIGEMEIVQVKTGAGYVDPSLLHLQTDVTDARLDAIITAKETNKDGTGLEVQLSNAGLTTAYLLYQYGVFVTHTDYDGPQLYLIAQCNTAHPDEIPDYDTTPVVLNYSLYLEHKNVDPSDVTVVINLAGYVPLTMRGHSLGVAPTDMNNLIPSEFLPVGDAVNPGALRLYHGVDSTSQTFAADADSVRAAYEDDIDCGGFDDLDDYDPDPDETEIGG